MYDEYLLPTRMPADCKRVDTVQAYRKYYIVHKAKIGKWTKRSVPHWWNINRELEEYV